MTTFPVYMTACDLEKSFTFDTTTTLLHSFMAFFPGQPG